MSKLEIILFKNKNIFLNENPKLNFFKCAYKHYYYFIKTSYIQNCIFNFNANYTIQIPKMNYLISKISLKISLPSIDSKYKFSYISYLSYYIFESIEFLINGVVIDKISDNYLYFYNEIFKKNGKTNKYIYNNKDYLIDDEKKENLVLFLDLPFYFCVDNGLSFPLFSCNKSKIEIRFKIRDIRNLINYKDDKLKYKNELKVDIIYNIIQIDDDVKKKYFNKSFEYLIIQKNYILNLDIKNSLEEQKIYIQFKNMIIDIFFYFQNQDNLILKQYYNYTNESLLSNLNMNLFEKITYVQELSKHLSENDKISKLNNDINEILINKNLSLKNMNKFLKSQIEFLFKKYYNCINTQLINFDSNLYLNGVKKYNKNNYETNFLIPYERYNGFLYGVNVYSFALYPLEYQPSGFLNFNYLESNFSIKLKENYENLKLSFIIRNYNILKFENGVIDLKIK